MSERTVLGTAHDPVDIKPLESKSRILTLRVGQKIGVGQVSYLSGTPLAAEVSLELSRVFLSLIEVLKLPFILVLFTTCRCRELKP